MQKLLQYSEKRNDTPQSRISPLKYFFYILLYRRSSILQFIYFLTCVYNYTKIKGLDSGKITSLPNSQKRDQLSACF